MHTTLRSLTDRIDRLPVTGFHVRVLVVAALSLFFDTLDTVVTGFVLAELRSVWHFDARAIGIISAIGLFGYLVGSFASGFIADYLGRKKTILYTLVLYSIFSASRGLSPDIYVFSFLNFLTWLFVGAESSVVPPYLAELWPSRVRGKLNGWMMAFFRARSIPFTRLCTVCDPALWMAVGIIPHPSFRFARRVHALGTARIASLVGE